MIANVEEPDTTTNGLMVIQCISSHVVLPTGHMANEPLTRSKPLDPLNDNHDSWTWVYVACGSPRIYMQSAYSKRTTQGGISCARTGLCKPWISWHRMWGLAQLFHVAQTCMKVENKKELAAAKILSIWANLLHKPVLFIAPANHQTSLPIKTPCNYIGTTHVTGWFEKVVGFPTATPMLLSRILCCKIKSICSEGILWDSLWRVLGNLNPISADA